MALILTCQMTAAMEQRKTLGSKMSRKMIEGALRSLLELVQWNAACSQPPQEQVGYDRNPPKKSQSVPQIIRDIKLQRGEVVNKQNLKGVLVLKWKDKKDILMMSTKHDASFHQNGKPMVVVDYNKMKGFVDLSDQIAADTSFVRKRAKWYIRLFFHLLPQTALVNAWFLYCEEVKKIRIDYFKELIVDDLLYKDSNNVSTRRSTSRKKKLMSYLSA
ncbi:unnamed protein product [Nippostrongylus brasiliensis]|uniref:PiggyBac transposable element-derived protein 4 (inferred by orthology to a human protein) n=1 Tax=Nippostrongylus brasiliensis TaxID=27835 RepID=A0A0N4XXS5_NIPBR|nr:unnamed protein product [Nippostrongylus brasiliensis]